MISIKQQINRKINQLPESQLQQFLEFLNSLSSPETQNNISGQNNNLPDQEDQDWLDHDLANLGSYEPYDWEKGELERGLPVQYIPYQGIVILDG